MKPVSLISLNGQQTGTIFPKLHEKLTRNGITRWRALCGPLGVHADGNHQNANNSLCMTRIRTVPYLSRKHAKVLSKGIARHCSGTSSRVLFVRVHFDLEAVCSASQAAALEAAILGGTEYHIASWPAWQAELVNAQPVSDPRRVA